MGIRRLDGQPGYGGLAGRSDQKTASESLMIFRENCLYSFYDNTINDCIVNKRIIALTQEFSGRVVGIFFSGRNGASTRERRGAQARTKLGPRKPLCRCKAERPAITEAPCLLVFQRSADLGERWLWARHPRTEMARIHFTSRNEPLRRPHMQAEQGVPRTKSANSTTV